MLRFTGLIIAGLAAGLSCFATTAPVQTISIASGNGQIICPTCSNNSQGFSFNPSVVVVKDSSGNPVPNVTVTWTAVYTPQSIAPVTVTAKSVTNASGQASYTAPLSYPQIIDSFAQTTVTASIPGSSVEFFETQAVPSPYGGYIPPQVFQLSPSPGLVISGGVGQIGTTPIVIAVNTAYGGLPNVAVSLGPPFGNTWNGTTISCMTGPGQQPGVILTNSSGTATCTPVFAGKIGSGEYAAYVGGSYAQTSAEGFKVALGPPANIRLVAGNNQTVNPGANVPLTLQGQVVDASGNPIPSAPVVWSVVPAGAATLYSTTATADINGNVYARVTAGNSGSFQVQATVAKTAVVATFNINVNSLITALQVVSGNTQQAVIGTLFTDPLIVQVNDGATPAAGATVKFAVTSGSVTLSAPSAVTNAQGQAQITATAGQTPGPIVITASVSSSTQTFTQAFNLTAIPSGPMLTAAGVTNAASFQSGSVSPCSLATIFGTGVTNGLQGVMSFFLEPMTLMNGVTVQFAGVNAPILDLVNLNGQESVTVQVPCEVTPAASVPLTVTAGAGSTTIMIGVQAVGPGIFQTTMSDNKMRAVMVRQDGSFVSLQNPVQVGDTIRMYVTGLGQTTPPVGTGQTAPLVKDSSGNLVPAVLAVNATVAVSINSQGVHVVSAQYADNMFGVYQVEFQVPSGAALGNNVPLGITVSTSGGVVYSNSSLIPLVQ